MSARKDSGDHRRFRLAANDNETVVDDELDTEGHRLAANDTETVVDELDTEGHRLATNDTEITVEGARSRDADDEST